MNRQAWWIIGAFVALAVFGGTVAVNETQIDRIADAIAYAEGFYTAGTRPARNNNPGDLTMDFGFPTLGMDGPFPIFATLEDGWRALKKQVSEILDNTSTIYNADMRIVDIAMHYANGDLAWAGNVAARLGVSPYTRISDV